ncbi:unnamed protein product [Urochloa humidicola]
MLLEGRRPAALSGSSAGPSVGGCSPPPVAAGAAQPCAAVAIAQPRARCRCRCRGCVLGSRGGRRRREPGPALTPPDPAFARPDLGPVPLDPALARPDLVATWLLVQDQHPFCASSPPSSVDTGRGGESEEW